jgi:hypothetical protein
MSNSPSGVGTALHISPEGIEALLDAVQWPAMLVTVLAAWLIGSRQRARRIWGFLAFILSNGLWIAWGAAHEASALIVLQLCLLVMNIRSLRRLTRRSGRGHPQQPRTPAPPAHS